MKAPLSACAALLIAGMLFAATPADAGADAQHATAHRRGAAKAVPSAAARRPVDAPFEFRGIPLGITLDEFRANQVVRATPEGSVPVCETDVMAGALGMSLKTDDSLTVACRWAHRAGDGVSFRLYEISFVIDDVTAGDLRQALALRYGAPHMPPKSTDTTNASGSAVPVYVCENAVSSITLCFLPATRNGTLTYLLKDPDAWVKSVARQWPASSSDSG